MNRPTRSRPGAGALAATVVAALAIAGCGSSSSGSSSSKQSAPAAAAPTSGAQVKVGMAKGSEGTYLTASGRAVYMWVADSSGSSSCSGQCAKVWPPLTTSSTPSATGGVAASDLSTISRSDGSKQVTYKGHPLYFFVTDTGSGTTKGQGSNSFGAKWWLVAPSGAAITKMGSSGSSSAKSSGSSYGSSTSSGGGGGGGWG